MIEIYQMKVKRLLLSPTHWMKIRKKSQVTLRREISKFYQLEVEEHQGPLPYHNLWIYDKYLLKIENYLKEWIWMMILMIFDHETCIYIYRHNLEKYHFWLIAINFISGLISTIIILSFHLDPNCSSYLILI